MGKAKKLRSISHKKQQQPNGAPSAADVSMAGNEMVSLQQDEQQLFQGLVDLQGSVREATCVMLANMFGDDVDPDKERRQREKLHKMIANGLFQKLIPRMVDALPMVRLHAVGALRNISVTGGADVCDQLIKANAITPLVKLISDASSEASLEEKNVQTIQLLEQCIALLSNLCESCQSAINELTQAQLFDPVMRIAQRATSHLGLHMETLKLLLLVTEGNDQLSRTIGASAEYQTILGELIQSTSLTLHVRLLAVGIAMNVKEINETAENVARLLPTVEAALAYDAVTVIQSAQQAVENWDLAHEVDLENDAEDDVAAEEKRASIASAQMKVRIWKDNVQTLNLAMELVTDMATAYDEDEIEEEEWASDDEDAMEEYANSQMDSDSSSIPFNTSAAAKALAKTGVFHQCVTILQGLVTVPTLSNKVVARDFMGMRIRVCNALNNLMQTEAWDKMGSETVAQVFRNLCMLYANVRLEAPASTFSFDLESDDSENFEAAATAAMWSAHRRAAAEKQTLPITSDEARMLMNNALQSQSREARVNTVGLLGCVGSSTKTMSENEIIGRCLLSALGDQSLEVVAEALNAVFDVYGGEDFDGNFKNLNFLPVLEQTRSAVRSKLRAERKQLDRALATHVSEMLSNLGRFIKYKKAHL